MINPVWGNLISLRLIIRKKEPRKKTKKKEIRNMRASLRWLCSTNAKDIGILYLIIGFFSALIGTSLSMIIRLELAAPGVQYINSEKYGTIYNNLITAHGLLMIFYF